jgi:hypothetical protein
LAPQYFVVLRDGRRFTRPEIDSAIARDMRQTDAVASAATVLESLRVKGDTAWATVVHRTDRVLRDEHGRPRRWKSGVRHEEVWVYMGTEWRIVALQERGQLYLSRDGEPVH